MRLKHGLLCDHATLGAANKPVLVHVFDYIYTAQDESADPTAGILLPLFYVFLWLEATPFEHGAQNITLKLVDADGKEGGTWTMPVAFHAPAPGIPACSQLCIPVTGVMLPTFGDYTFEIHWGNQRLGNIAFAVLKFTPMQVSQ